MDLKQALKESAEHWDRNAAAETLEDVEGVDSKTCALCQRLYIKDGTDCRKCPVMAVTGKTMCIRSPWRAAYSAFATWKGSIHDKRGSAICKMHRSDFQHAARLEAEWLWLIYRTWENDHENS